MEYLLIECREREISTPAAFGTHKEAHDEMCKWVAAVLGVGIEGVIESYRSINSLARERLRGLWCGELFCHALGSIFIPLNTTMTPLHYLGISIMNITIPL